MSWLLCNRERTDGRLHMPDFRMAVAEAQLSEVEATSAAVELVEAGLWLGRLPGPGYELANFLKWNLDAAEINARAAENLQRVHAFRAAKKGSPDPSKETEKTEHTEHTGTYSVRNALQVNGGPKGEGEPDDDGSPPVALERLSELRERMAVVLGVTV
jgi:hypothetical protein